VTPIVPPATIAMLGGGQLGKYALVAANSMGYRTIVLDPDPGAPAAIVANEHITAAFDDPVALDRLAESSAVVTTEFENAPAAALERLARSLPVAPSPACLAIAQDRITEKRFMVDHGIAVGPHVALPMDASPEAVGEAQRLADGGAVVKSARLGYDGKGQHRVSDGATLDQARRDLGHVDCIVEALLDLQLEVSVLIARTESGRTTTWPVAENVHVDGILDLTVVPARIAPQLAAEATRIATSIATELDFVGVLAVEFFVVAGPGGEPRLLVNEIAPRPHNSGHWTLDASITSQFEQQIRAVCGVGLADTAMTAPAAAMVNLLGDLWFDDHGGVLEPNWAVALAEPAATLHLYGKAEPRRARKMGHLTVTAATADAAADVAQSIRAALRR
jgi:5-(carboxyamino)imidazole ribonucleotide synthase